MNYALSGILLWGLSPLFWKTLHHVSVWEILLHRVVWSAFFLFLWVWRQGRLEELRQALRSPRLLATLSLTTVLIGLNWYLYIWGVNNDRVLETSLGYFILPLTITLLGVAFFKEGLRPWQACALGLAALGVLNLLVRQGRAPWLALTLAATFAAYVVLRKTAKIDALLGLAAETLILAVPATLALGALAWRGELMALRAGDQTALLLLATPLVTAVPLLWYTEGARRLPLKTLGVIQYVSPTCQFLLAALVFHETVSGAHLASFGFVWAGLALYTADGLRLNARERALAAAALLQTLTGSSGGIIL